MTDEQHILAKPCPACSSMFVEHDLEGLARCMDSLFWTDDEERPIEDVPTRGVL